MAEKKPEELVVASTGKTRAEARMLEKLKWQEQYYANAPTFTPSRQNMRFLKRLIAKKEESAKRREALKTRRQKRPL